MMSLSEKIEIAREKCPLPAVMQHYGFGHLCKNSAKSPFRPEEKKPSFSAWQGEDGRWRCKDFSTGELAMDEIDFIGQLQGISKEDAREQWFSMAGVPSDPPKVSKSRSAAVEKARASLGALNGATGEASPNGSFCWDDCVKDFDETWIDRVAVWRGYRPAFVRWLKEQKMIGVWEDCCAFPVHDTAGNVTGCHFRSEDSGWRFIKGTSAAPWLMGQVLDQSRPLVVHESQWDALALWDLMKVDESGDLMPQAVTRGAGNAALLADVLDARTKGFVVVMQQNDPPLRKDEKPRGNWKWRQDLMELKSGMLFCAPPDGIKDLNDWTKAGASVDDVLGTLEAAERVRRSSLSVRKVKELLGMAFDDSDNYLGDRMLAQGQVSTFIGPPGVGKSRLVSQMAICCILGLDFLGLKTHAKAKKWLFVQTENNNRRIQYDLKRFISGLGLTSQQVDWLDRCLIYHTIETDEDGFLNLNAHDHFREVAGMVGDFQPDFVVYDPLNVFTTGDLNKDQDMQEVCSLITKATKQGNPDRVALVIHHSLSGKAGVLKASGWDKGSFGRNSKVLAAWTRSQWNLSRADQDDDTVLMLACGKNNNGAPFPDMGVKFEADSGIYIEDEDFNLEEFRAAAEGKRKKVKSSLVPSTVIPNLFEGEIAGTPLNNLVMEYFDISLATAKRAVASAVDRGFLRRKGRGKGGNIYVKGSSAASDAW